MNQKDKLNWEGVNPWRLDLTSLPIGMMFIATNCFPLFCKTLWLSFIRKYLKPVIVRTSCGPLGSGLGKFRNLYSSFFRILGAETTQIQIPHRLFQYNTFKFHRAGLQGLIFELSQSLFFWLFLFQTRSLELVHSACKYPLWKYVLLFCNHSLFALG